MIKNDIVKINITDLTTEGMGIGKYDSIAIFVDGALPGEEVATKIIAVKKNYCIGRLEEIIAPSPSRVKPQCKFFSKCGGCTLQHLDYVNQLEYKHNYVKSCIERIAKQKIEVAFPLPSKNIYRYRNKGAFPVQITDEQLSIGLYKNHTHMCIDVDDCKIQYENIKILMSQLRVWIVSKNISVYNEDTKQGLLKHIVVKTNYLGQIMLVLVANGTSLPYTDNLQTLLKFVLPQVKCVMLNINKEHTNVILGIENLKLFGNDFLFERICDLEFKITATTFLQVNHLQTEVLYNNLFKLLNLDDTQTVVDLYCGIGTITLCAAKKAKKVYGIELVEDAIKSAVFNAKLNEIENTEFLCGDVDRVFPDILKKDRIDVVIVDPPRKGLSEELISLIVGASPKKIGYVSCNPSTLARDLALFAEIGYGCELVQPLDMFPQTTHVECVMVLHRF